jgi:hypothetical protein
MPLDTVTDHTRSSVSWFDGAKTIYSFYEAGFLATSFIVSWKA